MTSPRITQTCVVVVVLACSAPFIALADNVPTAPQANPQTGQKAAAKPDLERMTPLQKENLRRLQIMDWAKKEHPDQAELLKRVYDPVLDGNKKDLPKNLRAAEHYRALANDAANKEQAKSLAKYGRIAKAYWSLAEQNKAIVKAVSPLDDAALQKAFVEYHSAELVIIDELGKAPTRDWFMPSDFQTTTPAAAAATSGKVGAQGAATTATGAKASGATAAGPAKAAAPVAPKAAVKPEADAPKQP